MAAIGPEQQRLSPLERANLVAYLDNELNEAERRALSTKLTSSPTARREVEVLEKTWELLEYLPRHKASDSFTERTLAEIRIKAERGANISSSFRGASVRFLQAFFWMLGAMLAFTAAYATTVWVIPNPAARLSEELPLVEHLDELRTIKDVSFLNDLLASPDFKQSLPKNGISSLEVP